MGSSLRVLYVCYLSLEDPLVHTQVVAYLEGLARRGHTIHLLTYDSELSPGRRSHLEADLAHRGIAWHSLRYHKRPSLPATVYDALAGAAVATRLIRGRRLDTIHARNHVPAATALIARRLTGCRLIFDVRGLMADERTEVGRWKQDGIAYRMTRWIQRTAIRRAEGMVTLTKAVRPHLLGNPPSRDSAYVIPCCANLEWIDRWLPERDAIRSQLGFGDRPVMVYVGKFTGRYMEREMVEFFEVARRSRPDLLFLVLTQSEPESIGREFERLRIPTADYVVTTASPEDVGRYLAAADFAICLYKPRFSEIAASPTKVGEYLGAGLPVVATAGIGDVDHLVSDHGVGVLLKDFSPASLASAASEIGDLAADPACRDRCRAVAREHLSLREVGIPRYSHLYHEVAHR